MKSSSIAIKLILTAILGIIGIVFIMQKPPVSDINSYQKQSETKTYRYKTKSYNNFWSSEKSTNSNDISLMGEKGSYDQHIIGKSG